MAEKENKDLENGDPKRERISFADGWDPDKDEGEYANLIRYISTYRDRRFSKAPSQVSGDDVADATKAKKIPFYKRMFGITGGPGELYEVPEEWLNTDIKTGLTSAEVEARRRKCGYNELATEKENMLLKFIGYFRGPILYVMELAVLLAAGLRDWIDFGVIIGILMLNAIVGWYQEKQAADVVASLKGDIAMKAEVVRDGQIQEIKAREIVPGDILILEEGSVVAGECRLICDFDNPAGFEEYKEMVSDPEQYHSKNHTDSDDDEEHHIGHSIVATDQSAITGESLAVDKYMGDICYYTTGCKRGKAYAVVTESARGSFVGKTASLVQGATDQGHFKAVMDSIGTALLVLVVFFILAAWIGGFFHNIPIATPEDSSVNLLHYALILLIVGVPVGLPVVTTTTLAVGAAYLAKQKAIVQKLTAIESLAGVDVLCSDKTGTLTANQLTIREPYVAEGEDVNWLMASAALASSHNLKALDPIDKITILTLKRYPKAREILQQGWKTEKFMPFDPVSKRITTICTLKGEKWSFCKGAPKAVLSIAECDEATAKHYRDTAADFARRGFRSLGVASKRGDEPWKVIGMLPMFDPPREDTAHTILEAQNLGLSVKMLTGDAIAIAKETCKLLALGTKVYNSQRLIAGGVAGSTQYDLVEKADGFAEVFPEHKYQVVEMLQQRGHLTAMTGDGVNDAPSLKKSDCGIAVEGATEAAQAAADIVFLAPGLSTIVDAIKVARQIFQRMKAYVQYRIALCLHLEVYLTTSMIIINETIRTDLVVFLALFADLATIAVAYDNAHYEQRPVEWQLPKIWVISVFLGFLLALSTWIMRGSFYLPSGGLVQNFGNVQLMLFLQVSLVENWLIFVTRGGQTWPSWKLVGAIFGVDVLSTLFCVFGWLAGGRDELFTTPIDAFTRDNYSRDTSIVTVVVIWGYSIGVTIVVAIVYYILTSLKWIDNLGRATRSHADTTMENIISHLSRVALEHETDAHGKSKWVLGSKATGEEEG
ncbi:plasma-membrane proton-efflux P-type ATPase [Fonsecaea pedrosoi CBS 271.37]|uniref:Plasma membrane ATPase n=1 Tax=Fonsecaea pedrosoi CBS 271.37 TaxID=1442368 RepID=A0A0D2E0M7_9EURO|nr:plasma-membrane proton-efflux P-type ATPase [Fonsecaea pedrosoi CBS 271.37]KAH0831486.1 Plasma membrane ATPase [Fonsecaea pedrosoi]KIW83576.1 plasma-membrane proton-efflux P-type ATPase [Fonsecaea pedrosoi CBS 271.37]